MKPQISTDNENELYHNDTASNAPFSENCAPEVEVTEASGTTRMKCIYENIIYILENKKVYLDAHINLTKLSLLLCTNTTYLSKTINIYFKCNLKTLLNKYRIEYAKELLMRENCNIQNLPSQCGFVSRSTFYTAFTKFENVTPTEFRAQYQSIEIRKEIEANINKLLTL